MQLPANNVIPFLIIIPLVAWRMYSRIRRNIGRQPLSKVRPYVTLGLFPLLAVLLGLSSYAYPQLQAALLEALAGGIVGGIVLGYYGHKHTKFEVTPQGLFYTPNAHIGIALSVLFVGRIIYRAIVFSGDFTAAQSASPLTFGIFGLLAGYYVTYAVGLLRWRKSVEQGPPPA
jgi:hypothetical protein